MQVAAAMPTPSESATNSAAQSATSPGCSTPWSTCASDVVSSFLPPEIYGGILLDPPRPAWSFHAPQRPRGLVASDDPERVSVVPIDAAILTNPKVWEASVTW